MSGTWTPERRAALAERMRGNTYGTLGAGRVMSDEQRLRVGNCHRGKKRTAEDIAAQITRQTGTKHSVESRRIRSAQKLGPLNPNWRGGKSKERKLVRDRVETKLWREAVFARDDHTCGLCLVRGGYIEAHHITPVSVDESRRYELANGITLCKKCHTYVTAMHRSTGVLAPTLPQEKAVMRPARMLRSLDNAGADAHA